MNKTPEVEDKKRNSFNVSSSLMLEKNVTRIRNPRTVNKRGLIVFFVRIVNFSLINRSSFPSSFALLNSFINFSISDIF